MRVTRAICIRKGGRDMYERDFYKIFDSFGWLIWGFWAMAMVGWIGSIETVIVHLRSWDFWNLKSE